MSAINTNFKANYNLRNVKKCAKISGVLREKIDSRIFLNNNIYKSKDLAMTFAIKCPPFYRGLITSTGGPVEVFYLGRKEAMLWRQGRNFSKP